MVPECKPEWNREAITVFSRLPSLMAADKPCPQLQPSLGVTTKYVSSKYVLPPYQTCKTLWVFVISFWPVFIWFLVKLQCSLFSTVLILESSQLIFSSQKNGSSSYIFRPSAVPAECKWGLQRPCHSSVDENHHFLLGVKFTDIWWF